MAGALAGLIDERSNVIAGDVEQALKALRLLVGVNINPLAVLDQLPFERLGIVNLDDAGGNGEKLRQLRGAETPRSGDDLEAFVVGPDGDGLDEAVLPDALGKFVQSGLIEGAAGVGGGFVDGVDSEILECAAVLHDCSP